MILKVWVRLLYKVLSRHMRSGHNIWQYYKKLQLHVNTIRRYFSLLWSKLVVFIPIKLLFHVFYLVVLKCCCLIFCLSLVFVCFSILTWYLFSLEQHISFDQLLIQLMIMLSVLEIQRHCDFVRKFIIFIYLAILNLYLYMIYFFY